jgi:two-component system cell cycle sensor histidine kinase/response regulator CckA
VLEAESANEAVELLSTRDRAVDLLITDVIMPDTNGLDLARRLTAEHPSMGVLFISGYTSQILDSQGVREGSLELLSKPFAPAELTKRVREILDKQPQHQPILGDPT